MAWALLPLLALAPAAGAAEDRSRYAADPVRVAPSQERAASERPRGVTCLLASPSRIRRPDDPCRDRGRRYGRDDLDRTGEVDLGAALRKLDPAVGGRRR